MAKLTLTQRRQIAREYDARKKRGETALDIALRWRVHPVYVTMIAKKARTGVYAAQEAARREREARTQKMLDELRAAQTRSVERRQKRQARHAAILRDYKRGVPIAELARKYKCHPSYPAQLAKRAGLARRTKRSVETKSKMAPLRKL